MKKIKKEPLTFARQQRDEKHQKWLWMRSRLRKLITDDSIARRITITEEDKP